MGARRFIITGFAMLMLLYGYPLDAAEKSEKSVEKVKIIVNKDTPINSISIDTLSQIYTGTKTKWDNGDKIFIALLKQGPSHTAFTKDVVGISHKKLVGIWKKAIFTGVGTPPSMVNSEMDMIAFVASTKGAIGYVSSSASNENVRVISFK